MSSRLSSHPAGPRLDAFLVGCGDEETRTHVEKCDACAKYLETLSRAATRFARDDAKAKSFVASVRGREAWNESRRRRARTASMFSVAALAAGLLVFVDFPSSTPAGERKSTVPASVEGVGSTRFKSGSGMQVAVFVEHAGAQSRRTGEMELEPGDRIRLEVALDHDALVAAGVLADTGEWAELQAPALMAAGTHYSEQSIEFEGEVPPGFILVGESAAVEAARNSRNFERVIAIRVRAKDR